MHHVPSALAELNINVRQGATITVSQTSDVSRSEFLSIVSIMVLAILLIILQAVYMT